MDKRVQVQLLVSVQKSLEKYETFMHTSVVEGVGTSGIQGWGRGAMWNIRGDKCVKLGWGWIEALVKSREE